MILNPEQQQAVDFRDGQCALIAGPGAGKTKVLTERHSRLVSSGVFPQDILTLTFTREAAEEMRKRSGGSKDSFCTFHSFGYSVVRAEKGEQNLEPEIRHRLLSKLSAKWKQDYKTLASAISRFRRNGISPSQALEHKDEYGYGVVRAYGEYEAERQAGGWMDFECQPPDTLVTVVQRNEKDKRLVKWTQKRIADLQIGDELVTWRKRRLSLKPRGRRLNGISSRKYHGNILTIQCGDKKTRVTPNHWVWARFNKKAETAYAVYLMWRKDLGFRIGQCKFLSGGYSNWKARLAHQKADKMWILSITHDYYESLTQEAEISIKYGIPQTAFLPMRGYPTPKAIERIFAAADPEGGFACLHEYDKEFSLPLIVSDKMVQWIRQSGKNGKCLGGYQKFSACNLLPEIMSLPGDNPQSERPINNIDVKYYEGQVYSLDVDVDHTYIADGLPVGNSMLADCLSLLQNPEIRAKHQYKYVQMDEAQDSENIQWEICRLLTEQYGNILAVGDENQCQPDGTKIKVFVSGGGRKPTKHIWKNIENLQKGDRVVSWKKIGQLTQSTGHAVTATQARLYSGDLITIKTEDKSTKVTPNHWCWVRFNKNQEKNYMVYLMYRSDLGFRVGISKFKRAGAGKHLVNFGMTIRMNQEKAERGWILRMCSTRQEAEAWEEIYSIKYQIPESIFEITNCVNKTKELIRMVFSVANPEGGLKCLKDHKLLFEHPLLDRTTFHNWRGYFKTVAANIIPEIMDIPIEGKNKSQRILSVSTEDFNGWVHSLDIEKNHTYLADGVVVGNSIYGWRGSIALFANKMKEIWPDTQVLHLSTNYRSHGKIVDYIKKKAAHQNPVILNMQAARQDVGPEIEYRSFKNEIDEAQDTIAQAHKSKLTDSIILARTNQTLMQYEKLCQECNIPYRLLGRSGFWKQSEIQKAIKKLGEAKAFPLSMAIQMVMPKIEAHYRVDDMTKEDNDALANLQILKERAREFQTVSEFVAYATRCAHAKPIARGLTLSTIHQAKGTEFNKVFLVSCNPKVMPHHKGDPFEERRIFFVACSRPKDYLRISFVQAPSSFITPELTADLLRNLQSKQNDVEKIKIQ